MGQRRREWTVSAGRRRDDAARHEGLLPSSDRWPVELDRAANRGDAGTRPRAAGRGWRGPIAGPPVGLLADEGAGAGSARRPVRPIPPARGARGRGGGVTTPAL